MSVGDVVVIGSGIAGLTTAAALAQRSRRAVTVLERGSAVGGCAQVFTLHDDYRFDVGIQYVTGVAPETPLRQELDALLGSAVEWRELPDVGETYQLGDEEYLLPRKLDAFGEALKNYFPAESAGIDRYLRVIPAAAAAYEAWLRDGIGARSELARAWHRWRYRRSCPWGEQSLPEALAKFFRSPRLRALAAAQWPSLGSHPRDVAFGFYCSHVSLLARGTYYPRGGSEALIAALVARIEEYGGRVLTARPVRRILVERGRAIGVETPDGTHRAGLIVSSLSKRRTMELVRGIDSPVDAAYSYLMLFAGLREDPRALGLGTGGRWMFRDEEFGALFPEHPFLRSARGIGVSSPSLKREDARHTLELGVSVERAAFDRWRDSAWRQRGDDYERVKEEIADRLLRTVDDLLPGLRRGVVFAELSTPLTVRHFVPDLDESISLFGPRRLLARERTDARSGLRGLFYVGGEVTSPGISSVMAGGLAVARMITEDAR